MRQALLLAALALAAAPAAAQQQQPQPAPKPAAEAREPSAPLNLKLDLPARFFTRETPQEEPKSADTLPSLGGNAARIERDPPARSSTGASPFPKDTETGR